MKRAIVLGGGGSRGAYQLGAWEALRALDMDYQMTVGTSIGSINAALMAQGDFELTERLWETITVDQVMEDGINLYADIDSFFNQNKNLSLFFKRYATNRGADITPLIRLVRESVDEEKVRASGVETGLVTVRFPKLTPLEVMLRGIPQGRLVDYLMASAAVYPALPIWHIGEEGFIDGGYYDVLPVNLALSQGAEEIIAIDLAPKPTHPHLMNRSCVTVVRPSQSLGPILLFERSVLDRNRLMGKLDTLRAFGKVLGVRYSFEPAEAWTHRDKARAFSLELSRFEASLAYKSAFTRSAGGTPLSDALKKLLPEYRTISEMDEFLAGAECCAQRLGIEPVTLMTVEQLDEQIRSLLPIGEATALIERLLKLELTGITGLLANLDRKALLGCMYLLLKQGSLGGLLLRGMTLFPEELLSAFYLRYGALAD